MEKLYPFEDLEKDYYMGEEAGGGCGRDSEEEASSDDELQQELSKLAGIKKECVARRHNDKQNRSEFEMDMECELDQLITDYANEHLSGNVRRPVVPTISCEQYLKKCEEDEMPTLSNNSCNNCDRSKITYNRKDEIASFESLIPSKQAKFDFEFTCKVKSEEMEIDIATSSISVPNSQIASTASQSTVKKGGNQAGKKDGKCVSDIFNHKVNEGSNPIMKAAKQTMEDVHSEIVDLYDPNEDEENEKWMQGQRRRIIGMHTKNMDNKARNSLDGDSDAVLSCPGCMVLLTRDCQRHEIYSGQYRAMFVENCRVKNEGMIIEKTGKEKRRERQKMRKMGVDPNRQEASTEDIFLPVHCAVCSTNVAVMDHDEVYHFFNVLTGYA